MKKVVYTLAGGGWRAEFYLRIAAVMPELFEVKGIYVRNKERAEEIASKFDVRIAASLEELTSIPCDFIVNCISARDVSDLSLELAERGFAVLTETPACRNEEHAKALLERYKADYKIQVAEQYHLKGMYQAIKRVIDEGTIGNVNYIDISVAHGYHAMSLIRFFMDKEKPSGVFDFKSVSTILHTNGRGGETENKEIKASPHVIKVFDFSGKTAVYDFDDEQYFSPIRRDRLLIRGERGEIDNDTVRYFNDKNEFVESRIVQHRSGNLDGLFNGNITFENRIVYRSEFGSARITEEEASIAMVLIRMKEYVETGKEFYSFEEAIKDVVYFAQ